jgi:hypothetical protein
MARSAEHNFDYETTKDGRVRIFYEGRVVTTLAGRRAAQFVEKLDELDDDGAQQLMARMTGNFKRGNERPERPEERW